MRFPRDAVVLLVVALAGAIGRAGAGEERPAEGGTIPVVGGGAPAQTPGPQPQPPTQVTSDAAVDIEPTWSLDGLSLYFVTDRFGGMGICSVPVQGGAVQMVTVPATPVDGDLTPHINRVDSVMVFSSTRSRGVQQIFTVTPKSGSAVTQLTTVPQGALHPSWSPDGRQIAFASPDKRGLYYVWTMDRDGGNMRQVTPGFQPRWSPDGERLVFVKETAGTRKNWDVYVIAPDGSDLTQITSEDTNEFDPDWSPDGNWICYTSVRNRIAIPKDVGKVLKELLKQRNWEIWVKKVGTNQPSVQLTHTAGSRGKNMNPRWSPNGQEIAFCSDRNGSMDIWRMRVFPEQR